MRFLKIGCVGGKELPKRTSLWICVFYLGRGALTLYLYFLQVDTWEEVNLFNYLPLALYKSIFLFFCYFVGFCVVFVFLYFLGLYYNYPRRP